MSKHIVRIANPLPGGQVCTSLARALDYCNKGVAYFLKDGRLKFRASCQAQREREAESEFRRNRSGVLFWNGARSHYVNEVDLAMFPPGCNVAYPKIGTARAARRFATE